MIKRILAMALCLAMVMSFVPVAYAAEEQSVTLSGDDALNSDFVHYEKEPQVNRPSAPFGDGSELELPDPKECSCDAGDAVLTHHADNCLRKCYYKDLCALNYEQIFVLWREIPDDVREYMLLCLEKDYPDKLSEMQEMIDAAENGEADITGTASLSVDGTTVTADGVPVGSQLTVEDATDAMQAVVDNVAAENSKLQDAVFSYDISVQDSNGEDWQPEDDYVDVHLELAELNLPKWTRLVIVHVDDEGNSHLIDAMVGEDGSIAFTTNGFSTFAGFTVDFEYGAYFHSISGMTDILLSDLFNELQMPLDAKNVTNVTFTNYDLISVEQVENDWLLTSLKSFSTFEDLTFTMDTGACYTIKVTDAVYEDGSKTPDINVGGVAGGFGDTGKDDDNQTVSWYGTNAGDVFTNFASAGTSNPGDGWSKDTQIYISGAGTFKIRLLDRKKSGEGSETRVNYDIKGIHIRNGAHLRVIVVDTTENSNKETVNAFDGDRDYAVIRATTGQNTTLFNVENGSLSLEGRSAVHLTVNGHANNGFSQPLISLGRYCTGFEATYCNFENTTGGGIQIKANKCVNFTLDNCYFGASVTNTGRGGAIYMEEAAADKHYSRINNFTISNTTFSGSKSKGIGGAIALFGKVYNGKIENCTFTNTGNANCTNGGAIGIGASVGLLDITGCTFTNCQTIGDGGAVWVRTVNMDTVDVSDSATKYMGSYSRVNKLNFSGCTFSKCKTLGGDVDDKGKATSDESCGGALALYGQIAEIVINDCDFTDCQVTGEIINTGGGAIALGYYNLPDNFEHTSTANGQEHYYWTDRMVWDENDHNGDGKNDSNDDLNGDGVVDTNDEYGCKRRGTTHVWTGTDNNGNPTSTERTTIGSVTITGNCEFNSCTGGYLGGGILVRTATCVQSLEVDHATFDACKTNVQGSAVMFNNCIVDTVNFTDCTIKNCAYLPNIVGDAEGGTFRTVGNTTSIMTLTRCTFTNNESRSSGGGVYWNAANVRVSPNTKKEIDAKIAINNCTFTNNRALNGHGGGIFCEAIMTVTGCTLEENTATNLGGGIAMIVYGNDARMMKDGEKTHLMLDPTTEIKNNTAKNGGGVSLRANATPAMDNDSDFAHTVQFQLNGASIHDNTATECGGGVYFLAQTYDDPGNQAEVDRFEKLITIDNGKIYSNKAKHGGGIGMESRENTTIEISNGEIYSNEVTNRGGGIYLIGQNAECTITGGTIGGSAEKANVATRGGGIAIAGGASIKMLPGTDAEGNTTTGVISYNRVENRSGAGNYPQGGGVWLRDTELETDTPNSITITSGVIDNNSTPGGTAANGGGVYVGKRDSCTITGGSITNNTAGVAWGGGIYVCDQGLVTVSGGTISNNTAGAGAALCLQGSLASMSISDGVISNNTAGDVGGAVYAYSGAFIQISGGEITNNKTSNANGRGGAITLHSSTGEIYDGLIQGNSSTNGGGVAVTDGALFTMSGGTITKNNATNGGGLYTLSASTVAAIHSGAISQNTASGAGGGVYVSGATVTIDNPDKSNTGGTVSENTASNGGGVYVISGGDLTVNEGFVIKNNATGTPSATTAKTDVGSLKGAGGGVFIANGVSNSDPSTFTLQGKNIAIYENLADFAADDVYANGTYTKLNVPLVIDMNLAGYGSKAEGWFEDYATGDTSYSQGLNLKPSSYQIMRYRNTTLYRVEIGTNNQGLLANVANEYVCMTLGMTGAVSDVIVFDFGIPVDVEVMSNDISIDGSNANIAGISFIAPILDAGKTYSSQLSAGFVKVLTDPDGRFTIKANGAKVLFMLLNMELNQPVTVYYAVEYTAGSTARYYYSTLTIIPATSVYYEDSFAEFNKLPVKKIPVVVQIPESWSNAFIYSWHEGDGTVWDVFWPGTMMTSLGNRWYCAYIDADQSGLIINDGGTNQTVNFAVDPQTHKDGVRFIIMDSIVTWEDKPCHEIYPDMPDSSDATMVPIVVKVPSAWTNVHMHSWNNSTGTTWPGNKLNKLEDGWYYGFVNTNITGIVVNNGDGQPQSDDVIVSLSGTAGAWIILNENGSNNKHSVKKLTYLPVIPSYDACYYTIHVQLPSGWNNSCIWAWNENDENAFGTWPHGKYLKAEGNGWWTADVPVFAKNFLISNVVDETVTNQTADYHGSGTEQWIVVNSEKSITVTTTEPDSYDALAEWHQVGVTSDATQDENRPGVNPEDVYGYDSHYTGMTTYSYGSAMKTTVSAGNYASVKFAFWGTGFDVISMTSNETGVIVVKVSDANGNSIANYLVDTYYGYTYNDGKWEARPDAANALYQVPVIKLDLVDYGYYNVEIVASYNMLFDHQKDDSYDFYLDAIRIYNPVGDGSADDAYIADNEYLPTFEEIRDKLIGQKEFGSLTGDESISGAVYIDGTAGGTIADYEKFGPNNEVYLQDGQAIVFDLLGENLGSAQIGMKSSGSALVTIYGLDAEGVKTTVFEQKEIKTATELYYAITALVGKTVVIKNVGGGILSLTNLKTTVAVTNTTDSEGEMVISLAGVNRALASLEGEKDPIVSEGVIAPESATLVYEDEILMNIYFQISGLDAELGDLGLMTYTADGNTVLDTIPGAAFVDGKYVVTTRPIAPKNLGDTVYFRVYAKLADGSYVYSKLLSYSPKQYAVNILNNSDNMAMKALVVAMLNYGAEAQKYFGYKTEALVNADLTAAQKALVSDYSADMIAPLGKVDSAKIGAFAANGGFGKKYPTVSLEGAFAINYYFQNSYSMDSGMKLYYWNAEDYANADVLTAENATGIVNGTTVSGIAAKDLDSTIYVAAVYECGGVSYCTGVLPYSVGAFCVSDGSALAQAIAVYGSYAKAYFA